MDQNLPAIITVRNAFGHRGMIVRVRELPPTDCGLLAKQFEGEILSNNSYICFVKFEFIQQNSIMLSLTGNSNHEWKHNGNVSAFSNGGPYHRMRSLCLRALRLSFFGGQRGRQNYDQMQSFLNFHQLKTQTYQLWRTASNTWSAVSKSSISKLSILVKRKYGPRYRCFQIIYFIWLTLLTS